MSSASLKEDLLNLLSEYQHLLKQLLRDRPHLRGSFHRVHTRCGKSNCWCAKAHKGHPHARLTWSEAGSSLTRKVPRTHQSQVIQLTENYRRFRQRRYNLSNLESQIQQRLDQYENALTQEARKPLAFLRSSAQLAVQHKRRMQVRQPDNKPSM